MSRESSVVLGPPLSEGEMRVWASGPPLSEGEMRVWASGPPLSEGEMSQSVGLRPPLSGGCGPLAHNSVKVK